MRIDQKSFVESARAQLAVIICAVFFGEFLAGSIVHPLPALSGMGRVLVDACLAAIFVSIPLFLFVFRPLVARIASQRGTEAALRASEARYRLVENAVNDGVWDWDILTNQAYHSPWWTKIMGYEAGELPNDGASFFGQIHPEDQAAVADLLQRHFDESARFSTELRLRHKDGTYRWVFTRGEAIRDAAGRPVRMVGSIADITGRKQAEDALRRSEEKFASVFRNAPVWIVVTDLANGTCLEVNEAALRASGFTRAEVIGHGVVELGGISADDRARITQMIGELGRIDGFEVTFRTRFGRDLCGLVSGELVTIAGRPCLLTVTVDITARKEAENARRDAETQYRQIVEQMLSGLIVCEVVLDGDGQPCDHRFLYGNPAFETTTGTSLRDQIGKTSRDLAFSWPPDVKARLYRTAMTGETANYERFNESLGRFYETRVYSPRRGQFALVFNDITERTNAEAAIRDSEERYRLVSESSSDVIWLFDLGANRFSFVSPSVEKLLGYTVAEFRAQSLTQAMTPESARMVATRLAERLAAFSAGNETVRIQTHEVDQAHRDGAIVPTEVVTTLITNGSGVVTHIQGVSRDIADRKRTAQQLEESRAELSAIYDHTPIIMCLLDKDRRILRANFAAGKLANGNAAEMLGRGIGDLVGCRNSLSDPRGCGFGPNCQACTLRNAMQETLDTGRHHFGLEAQSFVVGEPGRRLDLIAHTARLDLHGEHRMLICLEDVTARRASEAALRQTEEQFRQAQKMEAVGQLAGGVAHDFNNILAAVLMYLGILQEEPALDRNIRAALKDLEKETQRGAVLTRQLLAFSRQQAMEPRILNLDELIAGLLKMLRRLLGENIALSMHRLRGLPMIHADAGMMEQVVINLCVNARDAMPQGGKLNLVVEDVTLDARTAGTNADARAGRFLKLTVSDTGCGMSRSTLDRIFEPFFTTKGLGKGTGLGLATVYGIVKQHEGWVEVESAVGHGSSFRVYLPACDVEVGAERVADPPKPAGGRNELVMIVEDEFSLRTALAASLQKHGYQTIEAADGEEALKLWEKHGERVSLLFTDMVMPGNLSGLDLAERFRKRQPGLKVVVFTGYSPEATRRLPDASLDITVLKKPADIGQLLATVRQCLDDDRPS